MGRRGNNEGTIRKRKDGRWEARISIGGKQRSFYGKTRRAVAKKMHTSLQKAQAGSLAFGRSPRCEEYLARWLEDSVRPSVRPRTLQSYEMHCRLYIVPALGKLSIAHIQPTHVQELQNSLLKQGLAPSTVNYTRAVLRRALGQAMQWDLVSRNVVQLVPPPKVKRAPVQPLNPEQARVFLESIHGDRLEALYTVAIALGLRQGEALGLSWKDIDFEANRLLVRHALQRIEGEFTLVEPKSRSSQRSIPLPLVVRNRLVEHQKRQEREKIASVDWAWPELVFTTPVGLPLDGVSVTKRFQRLLSEIGLPHQRFHDLRHACASFLLAQGVSPRVVMETLGHSQISLTMDTYSHVLPELQRDAADQMDSILGGGDPG